MLTSVKYFVMAIARVLAVKKFRKELVRLRHPDVCSLTDRELKNVLFRNDRPWLEMILWFLCQLDEDFRLSLSNRSDKDKIRKLVDVLIVKRICTEDTVAMCVQGRVIFKEREELVTKFIDMVKVKIYDELEGLPTESDRQQMRVLEILDDKEREWNEMMKRKEEGKEEKNKLMTDEEFLDFVFSQQSQHGGFVDASELANLHAEGRINLDEFSMNFKKMLTLKPCLCRLPKSKLLCRQPPEAALRTVDTLHLQDGEDGACKPKSSTEPGTNGKAAKGSGKSRKARRNKKAATKSVELVGESFEKVEPKSEKLSTPVMHVDSATANGSCAQPFADSSLEPEVALSIEDKVIQVTNDDVFYFTGV